MGSKAGGLRAAGRRRAGAASPRRAAREGPQGACGREWAGKEKRAKLAAVPVAARARRAPDVSCPAPKSRSLPAAGLRRPST